MKGNYIYIFLLGFQCALGIVYMGHKFFSGGTSFVDNDNEHTALSSSSLSEEDAVWTVLAAKAVDVNISGSTTTVKNKSDNDKNKETFKKKEEKSLRSVGDAVLNLNTHHGFTKTDKKKTDKNKKETDKKEDVKKTKKKSLRSSDTNEANDKSSGSISVDIETLGKFYMYMCFSCTNFCRPSNLVFTHFANIQHQHIGRTNCQCNLS